MILTGASWLGCVAPRPTIWNCARELKCNVKSSQCEVSIWTHGCSNVGFLYACADWNYVYDWGGSCTTVPTQRGDRSTSLKSLRCGTHVPTRINFLKAPNGVPITLDKQLNIINFTLLVSKILPPRSCLQDLASTHNIMLRPYEDSSNSLEKTQLYIKSNITYCSLVCECITHLRVHLHFSLTQSLAN